MIKMEYTYKNALFNKEAVGKDWTIVEPVVRVSEHNKEIVKLLAVIDNWVQDSVVNKHLQDYIEKELYVRESQSKRFQEETKWNLKE